MHCTGSVSPENLTNTLRRVLLLGGQSVSRWHLHADCNECPLWSEGRSRAWVGFRVPHPPLAGLCQNRPGLKHNHTHLWLLLPYNSKIEGLQQRDHTAYKVKMFIIWPFTVYYLALGLAHV